MPQTSMGLTAFSSGAGGAASYGAGQYQAQVARNNQTIANQNADLELFKGQQAEGISRQRTAQVIGAQTAGAGASGIDVNTGSPLRAREDTARIGEMDAQTIRANAERSAWGYRVQASNFGNEATLDSARGEQGLFSSLIGGGANFADKWTKYRDQGGGSTPAMGYGGYTGP